MTALLGAWSLTNEPIEALVDARLRAALRAPLEGADAAPLIDDTTGRLWLRAAASTTRRAPAAWVAAEGFVLPGGLEATLTAALTGDGDGDPLDGHHAAVIADLRRGRLTLRRSLSGGERLYVARVGPVVFFSASLRPLLAHPAIGRQVEAAALGDVVLTGRVTTGAHTLISGVDEVLAGCALTLDDHVGAQRWHTPAALASPHGDHAALARALRRALTEAVALSAGPQRPVLVALSGGIDSSAIAAAAVEAFGADNVTALTYEFDDPTHSTELVYARSVCARLGIRRHHVFKLSFRDYIAQIPEMVWRSECLTHWPKAFMLQVAREVARLGHDRYLTGFGVGSHMAYMLDLEAALARLPRPASLQGLWRRFRFDDRLWLHALRRLHPGLEPPHPRLYLMVTRALRDAGVFASLTDSFPPVMAPLLEGAASAPAPPAPSPPGATLGERLQRQAFAHLLSCIDVTRSEKASRELGVFRVSPAHLTATLPYAYLPAPPPPPPWSAARRLRPGKLLLRLAYRDLLPEHIIEREKSWGDAVASPRWLRQGRVMMLGALPAFPDDLARHSPALTAALRYWEPRSILATGLSHRLWEKIFIDRPPAAAPPSWAHLLADTPYRSALPALEEMAERWRLPPS